MTLPGASALARAQGGSVAPLAHKRLSVREGVVMERDKHGRCKVFLADGAQRILKGVPIALPPSADMPEGSRCLVGYLRGETQNPVIIGQLESDEAGQLRLRTKRPYTDDVTDTAHLLIREIVHHVARVEGKDWSKMYADLVTWFRATTEGELTLVHNQQLPDPAADPEDAPELQRIYFEARLKADETLVLTWPFEDGASGRTFSQFVEEDGTWVAEIDTIGEARQSGQPAARLAVGPGNELTVETEHLTVESDADGMRVDVKGAGAVTLTTPEVSFEINGGALTVKAASCRIEAPMVELGGCMGRNVAVVGSATEWHNHTFWLYGYGNQETSYAAPKVITGANEVKI